MKRENTGKLVFAPGCALMFPFGTDPDEWHKELGEYIDKH
jgi:hypothetical protein